MGKKPKTEYNIVDIAKALGISTATVSRALNDHPAISTATKNRVKLKAKEMNYRPNKMASSLRRKKSNVIGLIVPKISMYFHAAFITTLQNRLQEAGYNIIVCQSNDSVVVEKDLVNMLYSSQVDALVASLSISTEECSHFDDFVERGIPVFFYDRIPVHPYPAYIFKGDDYKGGYIAGKHLVEIGCKQIAYISGSLLSNLYIDRTAGFNDALKEHGIELRSDWVFHQELNAENAQSALRKLFSGKEIPDAVFAGNDTTAVETIEFAREKKISVPESLKVVGYSNDPRSSIITPQITTIEQYPEKMAERVAEKIMALLSEGKVLPSHQDPVTLPVRLIKRASSM